MTNLGSLHFSKLASDNTGLDEITNGCLHDGRSTLIKHLPEPVRYNIGDLSDR